MFLSRVLRNLCSTLLLLPASSLASMTPVDGKKYANAMESDRGKKEADHIFTSIEAANKKCFVEAEVSGSALAVSATSGTGHDLGLSQVAYGAAKANLASVNANQNTQRLCLEAAKICSTKLKESYDRLEVRQQLEERWAATARAANNGELADHHDKQAKLISQDMAQVQKANAECEATFRYRYLQAGAQAWLSTADLKAAMRTFDAAVKVGPGSSSGSSGMSDFGKMAAVGAAVGVGGYLLGKSMSSDGGGGSGGGDPDAAAAADPECKTEAAAGFKHCQRYLTAMCADPNQMNDARCVAFSNTYCGLNATTATTTDATATTPPAPPAGLGTQLCQDTLAHRYCQKADRVACYSCLSIRDKAQPTCQRQPAACVRTNTDAEMAQFKAKCPDDPVFSDPKWAHIQLPTSPMAIGGNGGGTVGGGGTSAPNPDGIGTTTAGNTPVGQPPMGSEASTSAAVQFKSIFGGSNSRDVTTLALPADVAGPHGPSVETRASQTIQALCERGQLNNCSARATVR